MEGIDLDELVDRLRSVTGYSASTKEQPTLVPSGKKIDPASALIAQQALRRHPAVAWLPHTVEEAEHGLLTQLRESADADPEAASTSTIMQLLRFLNETADDLEVERLTSVFADPAAAIAASKAKFLTRLGLAETPSHQQNLESYPSPWNVFLTLLSGPLFDCDFGGRGPGAAPSRAAAFSDGTSAASATSPFLRRALTVPNATSSIARNTNLINGNIYNTEAWQDLFNAIGQFPISSVREVWMAALYAFPTSGSLATAYLTREIDEVRQMRQLADCAEEDDAKAVLKATVRILNTFYRHLPLAFSSQLYTLFFDFVVERVEPDVASLDALYRTCLRRDIGNVPSSTPLWTRYLEWRATTFTDMMRRREWVKNLYLRILQIPLLQLDRVKESFENFVNLDLRGRFAFEEKIEMEKRFTRAKAEAAEIDQLMSITMQLAPPPPPAWMVAAGTATIEEIIPLYLPRPLQTHERNVSDTSMAPNRELELWASWQTLLERVERPLLANSSSDGLHYSRCRNFYLMRASLFPHQLDSWTDLVYFCLDKQPGMREGERGASAKQALSVAMRFASSLQLRSTMRLFAAHILSTFFHQPERASSHLKEGLLSCRATLLHMVRAEPRYGCDRRAVLQQLEEILTLGVNWMRLGTDRFHVAMVARFVMHNVELLSLTMAAVKLLLKSGAVTEPSAVLRPFNTFCSEWLTLELVRNRNAAVGLGILVPWKEHLLMMVKSAKERGWGMVSCGVDELFLDSCARLAKADPAGCPTSLLSQMLQELEDAAQEADVIDVKEFAYLANLRRNTWAAQEEHAGLVKAPGMFGALSAQVLPTGIAPVRYDSVLFCEPARAAAESTLVRDAVGPDTWAVFTTQDRRGEKSGTRRAAYGSGRSGAREVFPEDASWPPLQGGGHGAHGRPSGGSFSQHGSQGRRGGGFSQPHGSYSQRPPYMGRGRGGAGGYGRGGGFSGAPSYPSRFPPHAAPRFGPVLGSSGSGASTAGKRARTLLADSRLIPLDESLGNLIARISGLRKAADRGNGGHRGGRDAHSSAPEDAAGKESQRIPVLGAVEHLIRELPLLSQYDPECLGVQPISTDWLLNVLRAQEAIKYTYTGDQQAAATTPQVTEEESAKGTSTQGE